MAVQKWMFNVRLSKRWQYEQLCTTFSASGEMRQGRAVLKDRFPLDRLNWEQSYSISGDRSTLSSHDQTRYAVWDAGACCQERDPHDDIRDSQSVANYSHLKETQRHTCCGFSDHSGCLQIHCCQLCGLKRLALIFLILYGVLFPTWNWPDKYFKALCH